MAAGGVAGSSRESSKLHTRESTLLRPSRGKMPPVGESAPFRGSLCAGSRLRRGDPIRDLVRGLQDLIRADGPQARFRAHCRRPRAAGAAPARQYVFFAFGPNYYVDRPLVGRASHSRLVPRSPLGQDAGGARAQRATSLNSTSPAWRAASATEIMDFLNARGLAGYPPSVTADARFGVSLMGNQGAEAPFGPCGGNGSILFVSSNWPEE